MTLRIVLPDCAQEHKHFMGIEWTDTIRGRGRQ